MPPAMPPASPANDPPASAPDIVPDVKTRQQTFFERTQIAAMGLFQEVYFTTPFKLCRASGPEIWWAVRGVPIAHLTYSLYSES